MILQLANFLLTKAGALPIGKIQPARSNVRRAARCPAIRQTNVGAPSRTAKLRANAAPAIQVRVFAIPIGAIPLARFSVRTAAPCPAMRQTSAGPIPPNAKPPGNVASKEISARTATSTAMGRRAEPLLRTPTRRSPYPGQSRKVHPQAPSGLRTQGPGPPTEPSSQRKLGAAGAGPHSAAEHSSLASGHSRITHAHSSSWLRSQLGPPMEPSAHSMWGAPGAGPQSSSLQPPRSEGLPDGSTK